jgi:hypothetical protein
MYALLLLDDVEMQEEAPDLDDAEMQEDDEEMGQETTDFDLGMFWSLKLNFSCVWVAEFFNVSGFHDFDPADIYTMEDFLVEDKIIAKIEKRIREKRKAGGAHRRRRNSGPRRFIPRDREVAHEDLVANYFSANPRYTDEMFRRRFRMARPLFLRIVEALSNWSPYFQQRLDATGRQGLSPLQKCTAAIRMLAYGTSADQLDEVLKIGESTTLECLGKFSEGIIECFGPEYCAHRQ